MRPPSPGRATGGRPRRRAATLRQQGARAPRGGRLPPHIVRRLCGRVLDQQCAPQRAPLTLGQRRDGAGGLPREEVDQASEREVLLTFGRTCRENTEASHGREPDGSLPQPRFADPGLALEHQRAAARTFEERHDSLELAVSPDEVLDPCRLRHRRRKCPARRAGRQPRLRPRRVDSPSSRSRGDAVLSRGAPRRRTCPHVD
jgi:hypothetical protein